VQSQADVGDRPLDLNRVRGGMTVGLLAALQGLGRPETVAVIVAAIAGICIGMAVRKSFRAPTVSQH
jgi:outer membrane lipoprotein SlyB